MSSPDCTDARHGGCSGEVALRPPLPGRAGRQVRCDRHAVLARERAERPARRIP